MAEAEATDIHGRQATLTNPNRLCSSTHSKHTRALLRPGVTSRGVKELVVLALLAFALGPKANGVRQAGLRPGVLQRERHLSAAAFTTQQLNVDGLPHGACVQDPAEESHTNHTVSCQRRENKRCGRRRAPSRLLFLGWVCDSLEQVGGVLDGLLVDTQDDVTQY
jgi:hypothetical protein